MNYLKVILFVLLIINNNHLESLVEHVQIRRRELINRLLVHFVPKMDKCVTDYVRKSLTGFEHVAKRNTK